jgi:hypothetical protein
MREREAAQTREVDRERKRKREKALRAKEVVTNAIRKGKYPYCTQ